jgi:hypothetical protein
MFRTQIQLPEEQARLLKQLAKDSGKSVSEIIRQSVEGVLRTRVFVDPEEKYRKALAAAGKLHDDTEDLAANHDQFLIDSFTL